MFESFDPADVRALGLVASVDPASLSAADRVELLVALDRVASRIDGLKVSTVAVMADLDNEVPQVAGGCPPEPVAVEIACALNISDGWAVGLVCISRTLATRLPKVLAKLRAGTIPMAVARVMAEGLPDADGEVDPAREIEDRMINRLEGRTVAQVRRALRRVVLKVCPADSKRREERAAARRGVALYPREDAMAAVCATLPAADAQYVYATIDRAARRRVADLKARKAAGEDVEIPVLDAARADIFVELALRLDADEAAAGSPAPRTVAVIIDLATLLGLSDSPGELVGHGPISADLAADLSADGEWVRWVKDPVTGELLDAAARTYRPSAALQRFIKARDPFCRFPGCQSRGTNPTAEIDHAEEFNHADPGAGGPTTRSNLGAICKRHHQLKTAGLWKIINPNVDGSCTWVSPTGRKYHVPAHDFFDPNDDWAEWDFEWAGDPPDDDAERDHPDDQVPDCPGVLFPIRINKPTALEQRLAQLIGA